MTDNELKTLITGDAERLAKCLSGDNGGLASSLQADASWPRYSPIRMLGYVGLGQSDVLGVTNTVTLMAVFLTMQASEDIATKAQGRYFDLALSSPTGVNWNDPQIAALASALHTGVAITSELKQAILASQATLPQEIDAKQFDRVTAQVREENT